MSKKKLNVYKPPVLLITNVIPTLEKDGKIYAHLINAETEEGKKFEFRERRGMPVEEYIGKTVECIVEILEAEFYYPESKEEIKKLPNNIERGKYLWNESGYKFIPRLVEMIEGDPEDDDHDYDEDEYDRVAGNDFDNWGVSGLGLEVYQDKPMIETEDGVFLLNEYQNEEEIEDWELGQTIYFKPVKMLLRGINPVEVKGWRQKQKKEIIAKPNEMIVVGKPRVLK